MFIWDSLICFAAKMKSVSMEQRIVKFHNLGKTATESYLLLREAYENDCLSRAQVCEWLKRIQDNRDDVEHNACNGHPSTLKINENVIIGELIRFDLRLIIDAVDETIGIKFVEKSENKDPNCG